MTTDKPQTPTPKPPTCKCGHYSHEHDAERKKTSTNPYTGNPQTITIIGCCRHCLCEGYKSKR